MSEEQGKIEGRGIHKARLLHICDQNFVGIGATFVRWHRKFGHESHLVSMCQCPNLFEEDICLNLPLVMGSPFHMTLKRMLRAVHGGRSSRVAAGDSPDSGEVRATPSTVPYWKPRSAFEAALFRLRDTLWAPRIMRAVREHGLMDYDIYFLESGAGFFRDSRIIKRLKEQGKIIVAFYLGTDIRDRGVIREIDEMSDLSLTCEFDHLEMHPDLHYVFMPFEVGRYEVRQSENECLRICHSPRNRALKGSDRIIEVMREMEHKHGVECVLLEGLTHDEVVREKMRCDIAIDQIGNKGGTGYGMNSLETLSMGIPTCTELTPEYDAFISDHPFVNASSETLPVKLEQLVLDREFRRRKADEGRPWVVKHHSAEQVVRGLYQMYMERGWMDEEGNFLGTNSRGSAVGGHDR